MKYDFKYNQKVPDKRTSDAANRGIGFHGVIEKYMLGDISTVTEDLSFYQNFLEGLKKYENYPEHKIALDRNWQKVLWTDPDVWYKGVLDLKVLLREHGGVGGVALEAAVYDWKTGKIYPDHDDQKAIYAAATLSEHKDLRRVRAIHVYLDLGKTSEKIYSREDLEGLRAHWEARAAAVENTTSYIYNPGWHCRFCSFAKENGGPCPF